MLGSPTPVGKRPDFKQAQSGGMGWPRLVPVKDQQAQKAPNNETTPTPPRKDSNGNVVSPTAIEKPASEDPALSPILRVADLSPPDALSPDTPAAAESPQPEEAGDNILSSTGSYIANQVHDILELEEGESSALAARNAPREEDREEKPSEEPNQSVMEQVVHVLTNSVPYYAKPKITIQKPSESDVSDISTPRTIDDVLAEERLTSTQQSLPQHGGLSSVAPIPAPNWRLPDVQAPKVEVPGVPVSEVPKVPKMKKRSKAVRQTRRIAGRQVILQALLGRQLAKPTKQALKMLAKGENVNLDKPAVTVV